MRAPEFWSRPPGLAAGALAPLGLAWNAACRLRRSVARPYRSPLPVVCVGNLVAGGSGKTPVVLSLAAIAKASGFAVHLVTRGYGGRLAGPVRVDPGEHDAAAVGDEALLLAAAAPCWVARDRAAGIRAAAAAGAAAVLLDDGFQNPGFDKDLSLVVIDGDYGFGNGRVMPAGPLREPVAGGLGRADAVVLLGDGGSPGRLAAATRLPTFRARLAPMQPARFAGARLVAFAGIGRPEKFFATLRTAGAELVGAHPFPDHHRYIEGEIAALRRTAERAGARLVTTAKDWPRLPLFRRADIEVLEVEIRWDDPDGITCLLMAALSRTADGRDRSAARR
jgi:tetraacyldisaccharide 4'-kinase